jgi:chorismate synthase
MLDLFTAGESHGKGILALIRGLPAGFSIDQKRIEYELARRRRGIGRGERMQLERDQVEIISGLYKQKTTGAPVAILIENTEYPKWKDFLEGRIENSELERYICRPGHADYAGISKYDLESVRPVLERASARHTVAYVAAGAIFKSILEEFGIYCSSFLTSVGRIRLQIPESLTYEDLKNLWEKEVPVFDEKDEEKIISEIGKAKELGTTLGGSVCFCAFGVPPGLGSYDDYFNRLDFNIAGLMMSIPSVKAVEIGKGIESSRKFGFEALDEFETSLEGVKRASNYAGGIEGGISNGEVIYGEIYFKPIPTQKNPLRGFNIHENRVEPAFYERSDVFVGEAIGVIAESLLAFALLRELFKKFGCDSKKEIQVSFDAYLKRIEWQRAAVLHW